MTPFIKKKEVKKNWFFISAENAAVGRLAAYISMVLRGKNKATYNPHIDNGDYIVVTNIDKIKFTGKFTTKYYRHTGHPGGIKESTPSFLKEKRNRRNTKISCKKNVAGRSISKKTITKLKIYNGNEHPHEMQNLKL